MKFVKVFSLESFLLYDTRDPGAHTNYQLTKIDVSSILCTSMLINGIDSGRVEFIFPQTSARVN